MINIVRIIFLDHFVVLLTMLQIVNPSQKSVTILLMVLLSKLFIKEPQHVFTLIKKLRITSYNVCYTKLLRAGGGVALLYAIKALEKVTYDNNDQKVGIDIVRRAIQAPARKISDNAGVDGAVIVGKLLESTDSNYGYNAQKNEFTDMVKAGIIDPTKVVRTALQDAASVAGLLITTEAMIAEIPEEKSAPAMPAGGMGGMGGMGF